MVKSLNSLQLYVEKHSHNYWTVCPHSFSQSDEPRSILACEQLSLPCLPFLYQIMTLTCFQLIRLPVECSKQVFLPPPHQSLVDPFPSSLERVAGTTFGKSAYLHKNNKLYHSEHINSLSLYCIQLNLGHKRLCKVPHYICFI